MNYMRVYDSGNFNGNKEEGIYKVKQYLGMSNCYECYDSNNKRHLFDYRAGKIANTIEKLCDCFVKIKRKGNCKPYILKFDYKNLPTLREQTIKYKDSPIYGAIYIEDKGLIFVAKMNEEGELKLL